VDVDTTVGDPSLTASLRNVTGLELASMTVYRSQLQAP
jgi:hypothetical protein